MARRNMLIALVCLEAVLWLVVTGTHIVPFLPDLSLFSATLASNSVSLFQLVNVVVLALAFIIGMLSQSWQGAIALNLLASAPTVIVMSLAVRLGANLDSEVFSFMAPLAVLGWFGWLLRFARAEFAARI